MFFIIPAHEWEFSFPQVNKNYAQPLKRFVDKFLGLIERTSKTAFFSLFLAFLPFF
jgi:hypothetical protein